MTTTSAEETMFRAKFVELYYPMVKKLRDEYESKGLGCEFWIIPNHLMIDAGWEAASFVIEEHKKRYDKLLDTFDSSVGRKK